MGKNSRGQLAAILSAGLVLGLTSCAPAPAVSGWLVAAAILFAISAILDLVT